MAQQQDAKSHHATFTLHPKTHSPETLLQQRPSQQHNPAERPRRDTAATTTSTITQDHHHLRISDHRLAEAAQHAASSIHWDSLRGRSFVWEKKKTLGDFGIYTRRNGDVHHVMASGSVSCSLSEMEHILRTTTDERYVAAMTELYGTDFLSGRVMHRIDTSEVAPSHPHPSAAEAEAVGPSSTGFDLSVKTATFAKPHLFASNEQWCYLDFFQPQPEHQRFVLTMHSLSPEDVLLGSSTSGGNQESSSSKNQLEEMSAGYSVVADPKRKLVWVVFYAQFVDSNDSFFSKGQSKPHASKRKTKARLMKMAKATCCLPSIVKRKRYGVQVFADSQAFTPPNTHCICCTIALPVLSKKRRCHLCGYCVCIMCSTKEQTERSRGQMDMVRVCITCTRRVHAASYDRIPTGTVSPASIKRDPPNQESANLTLAKLLRVSFDKAEGTPRKRAVVQVIKNLLEQEESSVTSTDSSSASPSSHQGTMNRARTSSAKSSVATPESPDPADDDLEEYHLNSLETRLQVPEFALEDCVLANAEARKYPLEYKDEKDGVPNFPVPEAEARRLDAVQQRRVSEILNVPELEIICSIACRELQCAAGIVTIVDKEVVHVVAASEDCYQNLVVPREESMCSHTVMSNRPLLVPHADADIRFCRMAAIEQGAVRFYFGFPIVTSENTVIGTVCCVDSECHDVTQSQYAMLAKLASTASRIMELHANANAA